MHPQIAAIFEEAESRYLKAEELKTLSHYVDSLPERLEAYRQLQEKELDVMQVVADRLQDGFPQEDTQMLERSIKNALLMLRYCALAMLLDNEFFVKERLLSWLRSTQQTYNTQTIDATLHKLLNLQLSQALSSQQMSLLKPLLNLAQTALLEQ